MQVSFAMVNYREYYIEQRGKEIQFPFSESVRVRLRECPLMGMHKYRVWLGGKNGNWKKCPKVELSAYESVR